MRGSAWMVLVCALAWLASATPACAAPGDLDPSFSGDGRVTIVPPSDQTFVARALALQPDGRIVVAGFSCAPAAGTDGTCLNGGGSSLRLARLTPDGGLDPEFGNGGFVTTPIGTRSQAYDVLRIGDGSLVVAGLARVGDRDVLALVKYDGRGAPVAGFGSGGVVTQPVGTGFAAGASLAAGPDGTLYVAGQAVDGAGARRMLVARFTATGALDAGWGSGGIAFGGPAYGYALGLVLDGGAPVLAGVGGAGQDPAGFRFALARMLPGGAPDPGFDGDGSATYALGDGRVSSFANALVGTGGGWVAAGTATGPDNQQAMALIRGTAGGALDPGFGNGGQTLLSGGQGAVANDLVALPDGRLLAVGQVRTATGYAFAASRLSASGVPDPAFGGGMATVGFDVPAARGMAAAVDADGKLVTAGIGCSGSAAADCTGGTSLLVVARQLGDPPTPFTAPEPAPAPPAADTPAPTPAAPAKPRVRLSNLPKRVSRGALARKGLRLSVKTSSQVRATATLTGVRKGSKTRRVRVARDTMGRWQRSFTVRLEPSRKAVRRIRAGKLRLALTVRTRAGARVTRTFTIRLR